jgi:UDP-N-acetylglucosamine--N-acetylmuramyl-(pentapeptide) pyrophosphoryl-undecaprenol N-acetylglucosamine transferase
MDNATLLFYAINGIGMGHLVRLLSIARSVRTRLTSETVSGDIFFATTSDADYLLSESAFPAFKFPSEKVARAAGLNAVKYGRIGCSTSQRLLECLSPDILVVDTEPFGTFGEFLPYPNFDVFEHCRFSVFVYRPVKKTISDTPQFQRALGKYTSILVPESPENGSVFISEKDQHKLKFVGPIISITRNERIDRSVALQNLGLPTSCTVIYVTTGGGGHKDAELCITTVCERLSGFKDVEILLAPGPLYHGSIPRAQNVRVLRQFSKADVFSAAHIAISAAGYNTYNELMHFGIPTIFIPFSYAGDDQHGRAMRAVNAGAAACVSLQEVKTRLGNIIECWQSEAEWQKASEHASALVSQNGAETAANELLHILWPNAF